MPQKSNDFQRLVYLLKAQCASGTTVTESELVPDAITGSLVEVDIWVTTTVAGHQVNIGIECRDHGRRQGVAWINEMKSKHERLPTDRLVLVSRSGFAKDARRLAASFNIDLLQLDKIDAAKASALILGIQSVSCGHYKLLPQAVQLVIAAPQSIDLVEKIEGARHHRLSTKDGNVLGTVNDLVQLLINSDTVASKLSEVKSSSFINLRYPVQHDGGPVFVETTCGQKPRQLTAIEAKVAIVVEQSTKQVHHGTIGDAHVAWATMCTDGEEVLVLATEDPRHGFMTSVAVHPKSAAKTILRGRKQT